MKISFVIPAHNEEKYIEKCLDSVFSALCADSYDAEVIVVDNASTDQTSEIASRYAQVKLVHEPQKGLVRARRAGFLASTGDLIANIDADTMLPSGWIDTVLNEFAENEKLIALSGPFIYYDLPLITRFFVKYIHYRIAYLFYFLNRFILNTGSILQGGNFIIRRSVLEKIDAYNTSIDFYGEDTEFARRLHPEGGVKFTFKLPMYASGRRLSAEGPLRTGFKYAINYFWIMLFKRPFTETSTVVRPAPEVIERRATYQQKIILASFVLVILLAGFGFLTFQVASVNAEYDSNSRIIKIRERAEKMVQRARVLYYEFTEED